MSSGSGEMSLTLKPYAEIKETHGGVKEAEEEKIKKVFFPQ